MPKRMLLNMGVQLHIEKTEKGLEVYFPENIAPEEITGKVSLYRPSNRHLDVNFSISLSNTHLLIPDNRLVDGRWDIAIEWQYKGKTFLHKEKLTYYSKLCHDRVIVSEHWRWVFWGQPALFGHVRANCLYATVG